MTEDTLPKTTTFGVIREALPSDVGAITQMVAKLAKHHGDMSTLSTDTLTRDAFSNPQWIHVLVAETDGELIGYAALCGLIQLQNGVRGMDMHHLFAEAGFRGQGVGSALVEASKSKARAMECSYLMVGTHPDNLAAQRFYTTLGFERRQSYPPRFILRFDA